MAVVRFAVVFLFCLVCGSESLAATAEANATTLRGQTGVPVDPLGTLKLRAYSSAGAAVNTDKFESPVALGAVEDPIADFISGGVTFGPPIWVRNNMVKPAALPDLVVTSRNPMAAPHNALGTAKYFPGGLNPASIAAIATVRPAGTSAGAKASDPFTIPPGSYSYAPTLRDVTLSIPAGEFMTVALDYAVHDTRSASPVWSVLISATNPLSTPADLVIDFTYDPSRLTVTDPNPIDPSPLIDKIETQIRSRFAAGGPGEVRIVGESLALFSSTYSVVGSVLADDQIGTAVTNARPVGALSGWGPAVVLLALLAAAALYAQRRSLKQQPR